jgi:hypothetical protein
MNAPFFQWGEKMPTVNQPIRYENKKNSNIEELKGKNGAVDIRMAGSDLKIIGYTFAAASADETVIAKPVGGKIGLVYIIANVAGGLTSPTVTIKDGTTTIGTYSVSAGDAVTVIDGAIPLEIDGDLVAQVSSTGITLSAWAVEM